MRQLFRSAGSALASNYRLGGGMGLVADGMTADADRRPRPPVFTFTRKILLTLMGIGFISAIIGSTVQGTRSSFTASVVNPSNTFASGTLTMDNNNNSGTACTAKIASACGALDNLSFAVAGKLQPGNIYNQKVTIKNSGNLPATMSIQLQNIANGTGTLSGHVNLTIDDVTQHACIYGTGFGTSGVAPSTDCDNLTNASGVSDVLTSGPTTATAVTGAGSAGRWNPGDSHDLWFTIEIDPGFCPGTSGSTCDGWTTTFDIVWTAQQ